MGVAMRETTERNSSPSAIRLIVAFVVGSVVVIALFTAWIYPKYSMMAHIRDNGHRATAEVVGNYRECHRSGCSTGVFYKYGVPTVRGGEVTQTGMSLLADVDSKNIPEVAYAQRAGHVPIAYDVDNPGKSELNFGDGALTTNAGDFFSFMMTIALMCSVPAGCLAALSQTASDRSTHRG